MLTAQYLDKVGVETKNSSDLSSGRRPMSESADFCDANVLVELTNRGVKITDIAVKRFSYWRRDPTTSHVTRFQRFQRSFCTCTRCEKKVVLVLRWLPHTFQKRARGARAAVRGRQETDWYRVFNVQVEVV